MRAIHRPACCVWLATILTAMLFPGIPACAEQYSLHVFERQALTDVYYSEGAAAGDLNGDNVADVVYGPHWYAGPDGRAANPTISSHCPSQWPRRGNTSWKQH